MTRSSVSLPARYRAVRHIASGGMASVWEGYDETLRRGVAIKLLAEHLDDDVRARKRFEREARAAAGLSSHPHVVTTYDVGEHEGRSFIVMELMPGGTVADRLKAGAVPRRQALQWLRDAGSALDAAHEAGVVHRDVKPANLLLDDKGRVAIGDFGIARIAFEDQVTLTGQVLGTASYLSPEQAVGEPATDASDRYALAVVAFELLTGRKPFPHEHFAAQARAHVEEPPPPATSVDPSLPAAVDRVLDRGLAKDPAERWSSAAAFVDALEAALGGESTEPTRRMAPVAAVAGERDRSRWPALAALAALLLAVIAVAAVLLDGEGGEGTRAERPSPSPTATATERATETATASPTAKASPSNEQLAAAKNDEGFALIEAGRFAAAVGPLREAYEACRGSDALDPCGYALFNLGVALRRSGDPEAAVPILEERLQRFPNDQRGTVERELELARAGITGEGEGNGKAKGKDKKDKNGDD